MKYIIDFIIESLKLFFKFLFLHFYQFFTALWNAKDNITAKHLVADFFAVFRKASFLLILNLIALLVFTVLPQGKDILLKVAEDVGVEHSSQALFSLVLGVLIWSIISEYAGRYSIYVSDNSGKSLPDDRVKWRKAVQAIMSDIFLMLPYLVVLIGLLINYLHDSSLKGNQRNIGFGIPALIIYLLLNVVSIFYADTSKLDTEPVKSGEQNAAKEFYDKLYRYLLARKKAYLTSTGLTKLEKEWCNKLYGIYNDYVFTIRKPENFVGDAKMFQQSFCSLFNKGEYRVLNFPKDSDYIAEGSLVPAAFQIRENGFTTDRDEVTGVDYPNGIFRWTYRIPNSFYARLHRQLFIIVGISLLIFIIVCLLSIKGYQNIGSPGLVVISFACWSGIYTGILYLDYAVFRSQFKSNRLNYIFSSIPIRTLFFVMLLFSSYVNDDHPLRYNTVQTILGEKRPKLNDHFTAWVADRMQDSTFIKYRSAKDSSCEMPVIFICAEGGALRTGAYTSLVLSYLQDTLSNNTGIDFKNYIYAYSGVSGGSLGISFFNAIAYLNQPSDIKQDSFVKATKDFYKTDFLAPVVGKMFYGEILNLFYPVYIKKFDRAAALEEGWEEGYLDVVKAGSRNYFSGDFLNIYHSGHKYPALFINTTEVETGRQCWISNVQPDNTMYFNKDRDLLNYKLRGGINYSTGINFSTRFPLISPAAMVKQSESQKYHYVDGGYVENTGAATMVEVLTALRRNMDSLSHAYKVIIRPYVFVLRFSEDNNGSFQNINFGNEITEILNGLYNTRAGRVDMAVSDLQRLVQDSLRGQVIPLRLAATSSEVPMNWMFSETSINNLLGFVKKQCNPNVTPQLRKLFCFDTTLSKCHYVFADTTRK